MPRQTHNDFANPGAFGVGALDNVKANGQRLLFLRSMNNQLRPAKLIRAMDDLTQYATSNDSCADYSLWVEE
jgi:hypothetical protein